MNTKRMKLIASWDVGQLTSDEVDYRLENWADFFDEEPDIDAVQNQVYNDSDYLSWQWDDLEEYVTELMKGNEYFRCNVNSFGWRSLGGTKEFQAKKATEVRY